jgi:hypothetical protein
MLPETAAPGAETLPSATVSVERAVGSQLPLFVTIVTFQSPSYGVCAAAGTGARAPAVAARMKAEKEARMRLRRMNQVLERVGDVAAYSGTLCSKFAAPR